MGSVRSYVDLDVWHVSMDLAQSVYVLTRKLPIEEKFALGNQMRRAVVSISSNIAEGHGRSSTKDYLKFLYIAKGSNAEIYTQLLLGVKLGYFTEAEIDPSIRLSVRVSQMLNSLIAALKSKED